nr:MAG TPA: hypothetical protein [Caudoviricetes sp.]
MCQGYFSGTFIYAAGYAGTVPHRPHKPGK